MFFTNDEFPISMEIRRENDTRESWTRLRRNEKKVWRKASGWMDILTFRVNWRNEESQDRRHASELCPRQKATFLPSSIVSDSRVRISVTRAYSKSGSRTIPFSLVHSFGKIRRAEKAKGGAILSIRFSVNLCKLLSTYLSARSSNSEEQTVGEIRQTQQGKENQRERERERERKRKEEMQSLGELLLQGTLRSY